VEIDSGSSSDGGMNGYIGMGDREETTVRREIGERRMGWQSSAGLHYQVLSLPG